MSQVQVPTSSSAGNSGRYSKRKRTQINYYEAISDAEDNDSNSDSEDIVAYSPSKKPRAPRPFRPLPKNKIFPFLELPAEIRNMIYEYALSDPSGVNLISTTEKYRRTVIRTSQARRNGRWTRYIHDDEDGESRRRIRRFAPCLLAVCKQINKEGRDILYSNDFIFDEPLTLHSFLVNIGPGTASLLKYITLATCERRRSMHKAYNHASFAVLITATNIEKLTIDGWRYGSSGGKWVARQVYRDAFPWLEAVGAAKGRVDAAVELIDIPEENFNRYSWRRSTQGQDVEKDKQDFTVELSKLLGAFQKRIRAKPAKKPMNNEDYEL